MEFVAELDDGAAGGAPAASLSGEVLGLEACLARRARAGLSGSGVTVEKDHVAHQELALSSR